jgi:outer membrane lipoprotein-sorting protein
VVVGILIAVFGFFGGWQKMRANASGDADVEYVLNMVLNSHARWTTVQGTAEIIWYGPEGGVQRYVDRFEISQPASARFEMLDAPENTAGRLWISDGASVFDFDLDARTYAPSPLPRFAMDTSLLPATLAEVADDTVYHHPFSLLIPSPVAEYLFPHWFAQGQADAIYKLLGEEEVLQREAWLVDYSDSRENHQSVWIDQQTGIILQFVKEVSGQTTVKFRFLSLVVDQPIDADLFNVPGEFSPEAPEGD